ncbi:UDP-glucuronate 4-epimerase [Litoreibacter meonggei]|uniref:UDP-glucuronate 4-epimerase n=1 Tax=Litoreibacter meonggei TaxID=1049199 RepID=A0A497WSF5_9RHOB|nr:SDR family NAD(P)-dependent oxidoreductase [Litoreibacter meonggei]RLJ59542.1 UDP-glucuronate 4-epimerase [Litoreibacter meonggei]
MRTVFVTGTAGFIGFHLAKHLLDEGFAVVGFDGLTDYYDVELKKKRHAILEKNPNFRAHIGMLEDNAFLSRVVAEAKPDVIVHLAAQAGVRYSLENPRAYIDTNLTGTFNLMEAARELEVGHLLMASTSSVYGGNTQMPFEETQKTELPLTLYAATKKANEGMAHSYSHLWHIPTTMFRFFTVYGPYGRPDLALFKFVRAALADEPIDVYNHGKMARDFTYVDDLVHSIRLLIDAVPPKPDAGEETIPGDSLSPVAPFRTMNIGNGTRVPLMEFISEIEDALGQPIKKNMMEMQKGDVPGTWANTDLLETLTGYRPNTSTKEGIRRFVEWYREYYSV